MTSSMRGLAAVACAVCLLTLPVLVSGNAEAKELAGRLEIKAGGYYGWRLDVAIPSQIEFRIEGLNGSHVDVLILDENNYSLYEAGKPFLFHQEYSFLGVANMSENMTVLSGSVFILVDNSDAPRAEGAASPSGPAEVSYWIGSTFDLHTVPAYGPSWVIYPVIAAVALTLGIVVFFTRKALRDRKGL